VHVIYNPDMNYKFSLYLKELQQRDNNPAFKAKWPKGQETITDPIESPEQIAWRSQIHQQCLTLAKPYKDSDYPAVNLLPMWHGTNPAIVDSIFKTGYANLATTDSGYFGKGIYGAYEAEYSYRVYAKQDGALILNWTACFSPYPVMTGDMKKLEGKGNFSNYDAHFVPVVPRNPYNPNEEVYFPTKPDDHHQFTELVVFQSAACLPRYLVKVRKTLLQSPATDFGFIPEMSASNSLTDKIKHFVRTEEFTFNVKRVNAMEIQIHFTAADHVLLAVEDIKKHLITLSKLLQEDLNSLKIKVRLRPDWKTFSLSITGEQLTNVDQAAGLLKSAGTDCWIDTNRVSSFLYFKPTEEAPTVICAVQ